MFSNDHNLKILDLEYFYNFSRLHEIKCPKLSDQLFIDSER